MSSIFRGRLAPRSGLWLNRDFLNLWCGESISHFGNQIWALAIPLIAVLTLDASPFAVGLLTAAGQLPTLVFSLIAGAWIDRFRRRPVLIAANLGSAATLSLVPLAALAHILSIPLLLVIAFTAGSLAVVFDLTYTSYLPCVSGREHLVEANSKLEASASIAQVGGPGMAGILVSLFSAPYAVLIDAGSFVASAYFIRKIATPEPEPTRRSDRPELKMEIVAGLRFVVGHPILRALAASRSTLQFFSGGFFAVYVLFMARDLDLGSTAIGLIFAIGGVGAFAGAMLGGPLLRRIGLGHALILSFALFGLTGLLVPLAVLAPPVALPIVVASEFLQWLFIVAFSINDSSLRQSVVPDRMLGRVNGAYRFLTTGANPLGALGGGLLGGLIGLPATLAFCEVGMLAGVAWLAFSPIRHLRTFPGGEPLNDASETGLDEGRRRD